MIEDPLTPRRLQAPPLRSLSAPPPATHSGANSSYKLCCSRASEREEGREQGRHLPPACAGVRPEALMSLPRFRLRSLRPMARHTALLLSLVAALACCASGEPTAARMPPCMHARLLRRASCRRGRPRAHPGYLRPPSPRLLQPSCPTRSPTRGVLPFWTAPGRRGTVSGRGGACTMARVMQAESLGAACTHIPPTFLPGPTCSHGRRHHNVHEQRRRGMGAQREVWGHPADPRGRHLGERHLRELAVRPRQWQLRGTYRHHYYRRGRDG